MKWPRVLCAIFILILEGCQHDPWADRFLTRQIAERDVVGSYRIDQASLQRILKQPISEPLEINTSARIVLLADHSAQFSSVPAQLMDGISCSVTGRGSWRLGKNDSYTTVWAVIADEESNTRCKETFTAKYAEEFNLYGSKPPYKLHVTIGDPDLGDAIQFERRD